MLVQVKAPFSNAPSCLPLPLLLQTGDSLHRLSEENTVQSNNTASKPGCNHDLLHGETFLHQDIGHLSTVPRPQGALSSTGCPDGKKPCVSDADLLASTQFSSSTCSMNVLAALQRLCPTPRPLPELPPELPSIGSSKTSNGCANFATPPKRPNLVYLFNQMDKHKLAVRKFQMGNGLQRRRTPNFRSSAPDAAVLTTDPGAELNLWKSFSGCELADVTPVTITLYSCMFSSCLPLGFLKHKTSCNLYNHRVAECLWG